MVEPFWFDASLKMVFARKKLPKHAAPVCVPPAWLARFQHQGTQGLQDRSSRPCSSPLATSVEHVQQILERRRIHQTYRQIAQELGVAHSTVARIVRRAGLNRLASLEPAQPVKRYEHKHPGDMLHLDIKKLARFHHPGHRVTADRTRHSHEAGWEYVHVPIGDHSHVAYSSIQPDERAISAGRALITALRCYRSMGVCFRTSLREWAYAQGYDSSMQRAEHLMRWLHRYNWHRPHTRSWA